MSPRPRKRRNVWFKPNFVFFKPAGVRMAELSEIVLTVDELEAIRQHDLEEKPQKEVAKNMKISQPTLHRLLVSAQKKIADALVNGKAIRIEGGEFELVERMFKCLECEKSWKEPFGTGRPAACPHCKSGRIRRVK